MVLEPAADRALVLFSGGQDSTVCLAWALQRCNHVETIGFDYGQRHRIELDCRQRTLAALRERFPAWGARLGDDRMVDLGFISGIAETALTRELAIRIEADGLPNTFVPGRNLLFVTTAAAVAYRRGIGRLVGGMCETDFSGYPDCREATLKALEAAINLGMEARFVIETPLMHIDKAGAWRLAEELGGALLVDIIRHETHSCYLGERGSFHAWGHGCGHCPACQLRRKGYEEFLTSSGRTAS